MKLLVFSDTHGSPRRMLEVAMRERDADACIHLGDGLNDADALATLFNPTALYRVQGNCDYDRSEEEDQLVLFENHLFLLSHGHRHGVKYGPDKLWEIARQNGAEAALFGHTHQSFYELRGGIHLFNPGSLSMARGPAGPTYGRIFINPGEMPKFEIVRYMQEY